MIKVLHLIKSLGRGGAETLIPETIKLHSEADFEFIVAFFLPWKDQLVNEIESLGCQIHCFEKNNNWQIINSVQEVSDFVIENQVDLIHAHLPWAGILARKVSSRTGIPLVYTEHNKQERYHILTRVANKWTFNRQAIVIAVSDDVSKSIIENIDSPVVVKTILNGVNTSKFDIERFGNKAELRMKLNIPEKAIVFGTVAVFRRQKRLDKWVEIANKITRKIPNAFFIIIGDGPTENKVLEKIKQFGLEDRVLLPGRVQEVRPWLVACDIYMITSIFEGLPIALLEAMSMNLPVVTTDAGGIKEVVRDGKEGFIAPVENPEYILGPALDLAVDADLRRRMGEEGRERVCKSFSLSRMVKELEETYLEVLN